MPTAHAPRPTASSASSRLVTPQTFTLVGAPGCEVSAMPTTVAGAGTAAGSAFGSGCFRRPVGARPERDGDRLACVAAFAVRAFQPDAHVVPGLLVVNVFGDVFRALHMFAVDRDDDVASNRDLAAFGATGHATVDAGLVRRGALLHTLNEGAAFDRQVERRERS